MSATIELLDSFKKAEGIVSDNAAAKALSTGRTTISNWRLGKNHPSVELATAMCKVTGANPAKWIPLIEAEKAAKAANNRAKRAWLDIAGRAAVVAGIAILTRMSIM